MFGWWFCTIGNNGFSTVNVTDSLFKKKSLPFVLILETRKQNVLQTTHVAFVVCCVQYESMQSQVQLFYY